ncbi:ribonuclease-3 [Pilibacter termitis]|uniref:Ribonuclease 3 n=1 Tax=Pilibacter termitis TaxID=263852 RepID=A0A1T4L078_9ENTE|nr:ribonuclease III [Pilibacter termitis]SJZ48011.1 ribonuclease-3 [Pilibacter termitis]
MKELQDKLLKEFEIQFQDEAILSQAFTHSSYVNEHRTLGLEDNERLEFLGDAVLEYLISDFLYKEYSEYPEGKLSKLRSSIVREESLSYFAVECGFDEHILLGKGEEISGGRSRPSLLCDLFEAFLGALTLDQGLDVSKKFIQNVMVEKIKAGIFHQEMDFKTRLQEELQQNGEVSIRYDLVEEIGPAHEKIFVIDVYADEKKIGFGSGKSKKQAEQAAASNALENL